MPVCVCERERERSARKHHNRERRRIEVGQEHHEREREREKERLIISIRKGLVEFTEFFLPNKNVKEKKVNYILYPCTSLKFYYVLSTSKYINQSFTIN